MEMSGWRAVFEADMYRYGASKVDKYIKKWNYFFRRCQYASGGEKNYLAFVDVKTWYKTWN